MMVSFGFFTGGIVGEVVVAGGGVEGGGGVAGVEEIEIATCWPCVPADDESALHTSAYVAAPPIARIARTEPMTRNRRRQPRRWASRAARVSSGERGFAPVTSK